MSSDSDQIPKELKRFPMEGLEIWRNPRNGFIVFQLHYTANPLKRIDNWKRQTKKNLSRAKWNQEYEISWETWAGKPVYPDFSKKIHGSTEPLEAEPGLPLLRGWDFGLTPACVVAQLQGRQLVILKEFIGKDMGIKRFASEIVIPGCKIMFPSWGDPSKDWLDFIDPAGLQKAQTDETTCAQHMMEAGIKKIYPGAVTWEKRREAVEAYLTGYYRRGSDILPCLQIDLAQCPTVASGFTGGYQYPEKVLEIEPAQIRPLKNRFSHPHDGLQYLASMIKSLSRSGYGQSVDIPRPSYQRGQA